VNPSFWQDKSVLITGHTGFKGSWLSLWLQGLGANVVGYALSPPTNPNLFDAAAVAEHMTSIIGDVRDVDHIQSVVQQHQPEIVIHMAAQSLVLPSYTNPVETYAINVMGTVNLLEALRHSESVKAAVTVTSDKCYENYERLWGYRECDPMGGRDPYSSSKGCAELVTRAFRGSYFSETGLGENHLALASARAGNVIGGGDWAPHRLVPDIIESFARGTSVKIRNPHAIRPWQHVLEPLTGYLQLAERLWKDGMTYAEGWNFGPGDDDAKPVSWVVDELARLWGDGARWETASDVHAPESNYLKLDSSKAKAKLDWKPKLSLPQALEWTVQWYKTYYRDQPLIREVTREQISYFQG
jgi:CDP-glucose 4,6-dehydratase